MNNDIIRGLQLKKNKSTLDRMLSVFHNVNLKEISSISISSIPKRFKARVVHREIVEEFKQAYVLLNEDKNLMSASLLRNTFEDIMFVFAIILNNELDVDVHTQPKKLRQIVKDHCEELFQDVISPDDIDSLYEHLCKLLHPNTIKLCISYLDSKSDYSSYISTELKCICVMIECFYLIFFNSKGKYHHDAYLETLAITSEIEIANSMMLLFKFKGKHGKKIKYLFYSEKSQEYLNTKKEEFVAEVEGLNRDETEIRNIIKAHTYNLIKKYNQMGYNDELLLINDNK